MDSKICPKCGEDKDLSEYYIVKTGRQKGQPTSYCKFCSSITNRGATTKYRHKRGESIPMNENKSCPKYLGEVIAERVLAGLFEHVEKAPMNNPGWDFICGKKKRIDCKSSCLRHGTYSNSYWSFHICKNIICDYFLCLAFDDRDSLNPLHVWLIPGELINDKKSISITNTDMSLVKWKQYEKPIDNVLTCCSKLRQINEYRM
jgi:hypothetical protein